MIICINNLKKSLTSIILLSVNNLLKVFQKNEKYIVESNRGKKYILRVSDIGLIDGYFYYNIPNDFVMILKYYTVESMISHLPWAVNYSQDEVVVVKKINEFQKKWWDSFILDIPTWYKKIK